MYGNGPILTAVGFTKRDESEYDPFGTGHSSTSVSAALGMAVGRDFKASLPDPFTNSPPGSRISGVQLSCIAGISC